MKCRVKPNTLNIWSVAELSEAAAADFGALPAEIRGAYDRGDVIFLGETKGIQVNTTLNGWMIGDPTGYIVEEPGGELHPCTEREFAGLYEVVE